jgi:hypothetical protein
VYSNRTRGELQVAKNNFFCSDSTNHIVTCVAYNKFF